MGVALAVGDLVGADCSNQAIRTRCKTVLGIYGILAKSHKSEQHLGIRLNGPKVAKAVHLTPKEAERIVDSRCNRRLAIRGQGNGARVIIDIGRKRLKCHSGHIDVARTARIDGETAVGILERKQRANKLSTCPRRAGRTQHLIRNTRLVKGDQCIDHVVRRSHKIFVRANVGNEIHAIERGNILAKRG